MEVDVAVLGGGPAGYTAAIRAAQLGGKVVCVEREPALGGTCLRVGCIPTKAWVQSAHALHDARETFAKLGVQVGEPTLDFAATAAWKDAVVGQMTGGIASLFKANGVEWLQGVGRFTGPNTLSVEGVADVTFRSAIVATGSAPVRPPIPGLDSSRVVDSTGLLAQTEVPRRLVVLGGGIIGCEFASIFNRFGTEVTIVEMLPGLIPTEDADAARELEKAFRRRGIAQHLGKQCSSVDDHGSHLVVHFGDGESVEADLMLVSVGRAAVVDGLGLEAAGVAAEPKRIPTDEARRTNVPHIFAVGDVAGYWQLAHTALPRGRGRRRERDGPRCRDRRAGRATADLHGPGDRRRRPHRGAGARALRRRERRRRTLPLGGDRPRGDVGGHHRLGQDHPRADATASCSASSSSGRTPRT